MIPIVDGHHHIWRRADLPWLSGPMVPRIFGPYEPIRRDYPIGEFLGDIDGSGVEASVYVQTNWGPGTAVDEVAWVSEVAAASGWPHAIVGYADLTRADAPKVFAAQAKHPLMRGIRMQLHWHENPEYRFAARPDLMNDGVVRHNIARLADHGWSFDLQVFASQMADAARLAADTPAVTFVLQHCGMPEDLTREGRTAWKEGMARLAERPNVVVKLSALGTFVHRLDETLIADIVGETRALFGAERCLFGSNFPIEKLWTSYAELAATYRQVLAAYPEAEQRAMLGGTARRVYRVGE
jgi:predicted TIM-barrel fold metal-dependent hydrolase